jgi:RHS repeat-associated protein
VTLVADGRQLPVVSVSLWILHTGLPVVISDEQNTYIYEPGSIPIEQINNTTGTIFYLHHDQQGSTRLLTSSTGAIEADTTYDAYGNPTATKGTTTTPLGYDAQYTNTDTGLIYMRARTYDPATAQFLSVDPAVVDTRAPYNYANDNPLNWSDPTGLSNWNPFSESFWTEGNVISESPLNPIPYYEQEIESYENGCGYFASVAHGLEGAVAGAALFAGGEVPMRPISPSPMPSGGRWARSRGLLSLPALRRGQTFSR